ncbi:MAG: F0F1 ATP synthase subunit alpha [Anaerolineaceae bacterium]|nr:F0F1 ATP synthase subunit alpha [Anaerolineaceae bacterium]
MESNDPKALRDLEKHLEDFTKELENRARLTSSTEGFIKSVRSKVSGDTEDLTMKKIKSLMSTLEEKSSSLPSRVRFRDVGTVQQIGNGVATVSGLPNVSIDEIVTFPTGVEGMALNLEQKRVDLIMLGSDKGIRGGDLVQATGNRLRIPVGSAFLGRVIDPLGNPLVKDTPIEVSEYRYLSRMAHGVIERSPVNESLFTGTKLIDILFPIGRGQRELILGDRQTGKTTLAIDAILSQRHSDVRCIYVAIGQKKSSTLSVIQTLRNHDMLDRTAVIISSPDDQPALRYLAPYAGMTLAEYFLDQGMDVLVVFDDLTKHADAYRELSLLLRRPPGREAYPGDIFYLHSRLLERACKLDQSQGGGSITALPIATTQNGNISGYIPTNLISITDGQIVLDTNLFNQGQKPAIDIGRSVSRVGGAAQKPAIRTLVGDLKLELSQYQEVEHFTRFGTEVDEATRKQIKKGQRILAVLKQKPHEPISCAGTVVILYALNHGYLDRIPIRQMAKFKTNISSHFTEHETKLMSEIEKEGELTDPIKEQLTRALDFFTQAWLEEKGANQ